MPKESSKGTDYNTSCRICLKSPSPRQIIHLFKTKDDLLPATAVSDIANVEILPGDDLPQQLCNPCWKKVQTSFLLIREIQKSDKLLRSNIIGISSEFVKTELIDDILEVKHELVFADDGEDMKFEQEAIPTNDNETTDVEKSGRVRVPRKIPSDPKCCMCRFVCTTVEELESHVTETHPDPKHKSVVSHKSAKCKYCFKGFQNNRSLLEHFRKPYIDRNHQCTQCGQTFSSPSSLMHHELTHKQIKDVICEICQKSFRAPKNLRRHMKSHDDKNKLQCDLCSALFPEKKQLEYHIKSHINIRDRLCSVCGMGFVHNSLLKLHMRKHTGERPHKCGICGKAYKHNTDLRRHKYQHEGIRPFKCSFCEKTFYQRSNMKVHERVHTGATPYSCTLCGQKFKFHTHWKKHEKRHQEQGGPVTMDWLT